MSCFQELRSVRNRKSAEEDKCQCPEDLLEKSDIQELNYWISRFVAEVQNKRENFTSPPPFISLDYKDTCLPRILGKRSQVS